MANIYVLLLGVAASAQLMAAYGNPTSNAINQAANPAINQNANPVNNNQINNNAVNTQRNQNWNGQAAYTDQAATAQKPVSADAIIIGQVQDRIKGAYKQYRIEVSVVNGIATLTGFVNSQLDKDAIERDVKNVPGITKVNNQLTIQK
ncbi:MAG: BON domain-containing protein [Parachlamydiaceae bacterium]